MGLGLLERVKNAVVAPEYPRYNITIKRSLERIPTKHKTALDRLITKNRARVVKDAGERYLGEFHVTNKGRLVRGNILGLHTYFGEVDLNLGGPQPHIHFARGGVNDILPSCGTNDVFLSEDKKAYEIRKKEKGVPEYIRLDLPEPQPTYTLDGLYLSIPDQKPETKLDALVKRLDHDIILDDKGKFSRFREESLASEELKLKLLENKYKKVVSNQ